MTKLTANPSPGVSLSSDLSTIQSRENELLPSLGFSTPQIFPGSDLSRFAAGLQPSANLFLSPSAYRLGLSLRQPGPKGCGGRHASSVSCGDSKGGPREGLVYVPSCPVTLRPAGHSGPLGNVLHPVRPAARPAPRPHSPGTSWCSTARGRAARVPPATRASRLSRSLDRQQPVHFAPPARLPACLAALPLAAVVPYANESRWAGRAGYCGLRTSPPPAAAGPASEGPQKTPLSPISSFSSGVAPLLSLQMLAFCLPYPPTLAYSRVSAAYDSDLNSYAKWG